MEPQNFMTSFDKGYNFNVHHQPPMKIYFKKKNKFIKHLTNAEIFNDPLNAIF